jgi:hypothetical protein
MTRVFNFSAGPAALPPNVLEQAAAEMLDWRGSGMSVMEMSCPGSSAPHQLGAAAQARIYLRHNLCTSWSALKLRFDIDVQHCLNCGGRAQNHRGDPGASGD